MKALLAALIIGSGIAFAGWELAHRPHWRIESHVGYIMRADENTGRTEIFIGGQWRDLDQFQQPRTVATPTPAPSAAPAAFDPNKPYRVHPLIGSGPQGIFIEWKDRGGNTVRRLLQPHETIPAWVEVP